MALLVNGELLSDAAIAHHLSLLQAASAHPEAAASSADPRLVGSAEENAILQMLLRQAAASAFPHIDEAEIAAELAHRRGTQHSTTCSAGERALLIQSLQTRRWVTGITSQVPRPHPRVVEQTYRAQRDRFKLPEMVHARHIVANVDGGRDESTARSILEQALAALHAGKPFPRVADRFSDCAGVGGDLGWIRRGEMVDDFEAVVFALRPGALSPIFRTVFGFHVATVDARRAPRQQSFSEVRAELARELHEDRRQAALLAHLRSLAAQSDIRPIEAHP